jgi:peptidyl-tRNA hydrolase, PTH1 family
MSEESPVLIAGLGNPGPEYAGHRHNIGFLVVDRLARRLGLTFSGVPSGGRAAAHAATGRTENRRAVILVKPQLYMNRSGEALQQWSHHQAVSLNGSTDPEETGIRPLIVCDDLALRLGSLRLRERGSSGGQNGLDSVIQVFGGEEVPRLRLGIGPLGEELPPEAWADYVLSPFLHEETETVVDLVDRAVQALESFLDNGLEFAASRFNRRVLPEPD